MRAVRRGTLPVLASEEIKRDITKGTFKPGEKLPTEQELCRMLDIGRPTLREALRFLEGQGIIEFRFGEGAYVVDGTSGGSAGARSAWREETFELLQKEMDQLREEGRELPPDLSSRLANLPADGSTDRVERIYDELGSLPMQPAFPYVEPDLREPLQPGRRDGWKAAGSSRSGLSATNGGSRVSESVLRDRIHGAWLGRCLGCNLGKPVEHWPKAQIERYLKTVGAYPLNGFIPYSPDILTDDDFSLHKTALSTTLGNIDRAVRDDDTDYTVLNLKILNAHGTDFSTEDVVDEWLFGLAFKNVYTAERRAYANLVAGFVPPASAIHRNPFREWIGAQIRADVFGYVSPGDPGKAVSMAIRDASVSHVKNGVYGEAFVAAVLASALGGESLSEAIETGLSYVPPESRYAEVVRNSIAWSRQSDDWETVWNRINVRYGHYDPVHVLPNIGFTILSLLHGNLDYRKTVTIAVMCGSDTDCNAATAGSIVGAIAGTRNLPRDMTSVLNDTIETAVVGRSHQSIRGTADEMFRMAVGAS